MMAADDIAQYPAHPESVRRLIEALERASPDEAARAVEADVVLTVRVLERANRRRGETDTVARAVGALADDGLLAMAREVIVEHPLDRLTPSGSVRERFRQHALSVRGVTQRLADILGRPDRDQLLTAAILHDVGRLVLHDESAPASDDVLTPEQRALSERTRLGTDHAQAGALLARQWRFPAELALAIECHHTAVDDSPGAVVGLADMLVHYAAGRLIDLERAFAVSQGLGISRADLGQLMYDLPMPMGAPASPPAEPCPLTARELDVLRSLAAGNVYKQIALELQLSPSTVRTHLHNIYSRIGAVDRAQAVLMATERGWI